MITESPKSPYLLIDSRRLDPGNLFVPVKENSRLSVECVVEGGAPAPGLHWLLVPPPGAASPPGLSPAPSSSHAHNGFTASIATIPRVLRAHHNSTVACIVTHPTLPAPLNASILLDVQCKSNFYFLLFNQSFITNLLFFLLLFTVLNNIIQLWTLIPLKILKKYL
ncbi:hypothetical protein O3M35_005659 [Rhynocoris fuscipes]|uniref:Ig-like domain-containing protein n=1 Tax=Rhynocoris fuscipes TaxID=488301 RepID=A0AAW1DMQ3_9HEMI